jgi:hypothetical protein
VNLLATLVTEEKERNKHAEMLVHIYLNLVAQSLKSLNSGSKMSLGE